MRRRRFLVLAVAAALLLLGIVGYWIPLKPEITPKRIFFASTGGPVVFQHAEHARKRNIPCQRCHHDQKARADVEGCMKCHTTLPGVEPVHRRGDVQACGKCHNVTFDERFKALHRSSFSPGSCTICHHQELLTKYWGHERHPELTEIGCQDCHHKDTALDAKPRNCAVCHTGGDPRKMPREENAPPSLKDAVHKRCNACHKDVFQTGVDACRYCHTPINTHELPIGKGGPALPDRRYTDCAVCHGSTFDRLPTGNGDAYHGMCMGCHEQMKKGPYGKDSCSGCHAK